MNDTEELIKAALAKQAERAPHGGPIRNALNRPRSRRVRPAVLVLVGACVVAALIAVPIALSQSPAPVGPAGPVPPPDLTAITMTYKATDVPAGFVEVERTADNYGGLQARTWRDSTGATIKLTVLTPKHMNWYQVNSVKPIDGQQVMVNGVDGTVGKPTSPVREGATELVWRPNKSEHFSVTVADLPDQRAVALRAAESVQPDGSATVRPLLVFWSLPASFTRVSVTVSADSAPAGGRVLVTTEGEASTQVLAMILPNGTRIESGATVVELPDHRQLQILFGGAALPEHQRQDIIAGVKLVADPDLSWLGK